MARALLTRPFPTLPRGEGHVWRTAIEVPRGAELEYKLVHLSPGWARWEEADNHHFAVAPMGRPPPASLSALNA